MGPHQFRKERQATRFSPASPQNWPEGSPWLARALQNLTES